LHGPQVAPPDPHVESPSLAIGTQEEPLQQPAHDEPPQEHTPLAHVWPAPHTLHVAPWVPHEPGPCAA
jgi:hypothetical protein